MPHSVLQTESSLLLQADEAGVRRLTLNRPRQRNALSMNLMQSVIDALDTADTDPKIKVIVIAASGPVFCSGHDLKEITQTTSPDFFDRLFAKCSEMMMRIQSVNQPVIAMVQGSATAAGCQLVATCDLALTSESASFTTPGVNIGLFCSTPMVALSRAVHRKHAMQMLLSGDSISAQRAFEIGLVSNVVQDDTLEKTCFDLAHKIALKSPRALKFGKDAFYRQIEMPTEEAYAFASKVMSANMQDPDAEEGIGAFLEKRNPNWPSA